jgi:hemolysin III
MTEQRYTVKEEIASSITHGLGIVFSIVGLVVLVNLAVSAADPWRIVSASIFGASMIILYLASTLYHALPWPSVKSVMRVFDHCAIYLLIAGTYTPFLLVSMRGPWGWSLLVVMWGIAVLGCAFKAFHTGKFDKLSTALYVAMGWMIVVALKPALEMVPPGAMVLMAIGGAAYTGGVFFYACNRIPYNHAIWHGFVLAGTVAHFFAILFYVVLNPAAGA